MQIFLMTLVSLGRWTEFIRALKRLYDKCYGDTLSSM